MYVRLHNPLMSLLINLYCDCGENEIKYIHCINHFSVLYSAIMQGYIARPFLGDKKWPGHHCWNMHANYSIK